MSTGTVLLFLMLLACPLLMWRMHRGGGHAHGPTSGSAGDGHARHGCGHGGQGGRESGEDERSIDELRRDRDELDAEIRRREQATEPPLR